MFQVKRFGRTWALVVVPARQHDFPLLSTRPITPRATNKALLPQLHCVPRPQRHFGGNAVKVCKSIIVLQHICLLAHSSA
eukprot:jgi/Botrbrau1/19177/Bobra.0077s0086.1